MTALLLCLSAFGQDTLEVRDDARTLTVTVTDESGRPVLGALVAPGSAATSRVSVAVFDDDDARRTGAAGVAELSVPTAFDDDPVVRINFTVSHPKFLTVAEETWDWRQPHGQPMEAAVRLRRGRPVTVNLVWLDGEADPAGCVVSCPESHGGTVGFNVVDGRLVTEPVPTEADWVRVSCGVGGRPQGSDWTRIEDGRATALIEAGRTVRGRLSDDVPRPVKGGRGLARFTTAEPLPRGVELGAAAFEIAADGTFELADVPPTADVQLVAAARGWTSAPVSSTEFARQAARHGTNFGRVSGGSVTAQVFSPGEGGWSGDGPTVAMRPSGGLRVLVVDEAGRPRPGATVSAGVRAFFHHNRTAAFPSAPRAVADADGVAEFPDLPAGRRVSLVATLGEGDFRPYVEDTSAVIEPGRVLDHALALWTGQPKTP